MIVVHFLMVQAPLFFVLKNFAKEHGSNYVEVIGSGRGGSPAALQGRDHMTTIPSTKIAATDAYKMAGITAKDVDFAEVHDCFTIAEVVDTEDFRIL